MESCFKTPIHIIVLYCILVHAEAGIDIVDHENSPEVIANERNTRSDVDGVNGSAPRPGTASNGRDAPSQPSSSFTSASTSAENGNASNEINQNGSNGRSKYYYNNNQINHNQRVNSKYDDEQTYLDVFGERAKELFTQHIIPFTDAECRWDWRMGRCEPYCSCGFQFLWGDFHLGRSCRLRPNPPPSQFAKDGTVSSNEHDTGETPWQEAWQEVWTSQMTEETVDESSTSSFVPPMFPKVHPDVATETVSWDRTSNTCALPPESRYIQIIRQLTTQTVTHSTVVMDQYQKLKNVTLNAANSTMVQGQHHWTNLRQKSCEIVKKKVEERAKIRDQPVVLTRQGATWIRRVCGGSSDGNVREMDGAPTTTTTSNSSGEDEGGANRREEYPADN